MKKIILPFLLLLATTSYSQTEIIGVIAGGEYVKNILKQFEVTSNQLMSNANNTGNALIAKTANELDVTAKNLNLLLEKDLDKTFSKLSSENQKLLNQIESFRLTAEKMTNSTFELKDAMVIDVKKIVGDIAPWAKSSFFVQRVDGITQLKQEQADYRMKVMGIGFGFNSDKYESRIKTLKINGDIITNFSENKLSASESEIVISYSTINNKTINGKNSQIKVIATIETKTKKGLIFKNWVVKDFNLPITITILPRQICSVHLSYTSPKLDWVTIVPFSQYNYTTPNHHQEKKPIIHYTYEQPHRLPDNQRFITKVANSQSASGQGCPWTNFNSLDILENGKLLKAKFEAWGYPCTYYYGATIQEFKEVGSEDITIPDICIEYEKNIIIELPKDTKFWRIQAQTADFKTIDIIGQNNYGNLIRFDNVITVGDKMRVIYKVNLPY
ncbi:hypothetical protein [Flavobacterium sp. HJJ]|uniref:hypothetical protein n=1 Tax=Flavobacterium sp. HJJ TaxID=2783792 RepID=UPI00188B025A|nr:hypothetical protein [Flavobacterium sp. HJJ]MBF4472040.1 hypothetical protein [Flavobacterium sp. HJJ]